MNEIERLLNNGFIDNDFLKEEKRDGYTITTSIKKVWAIQLYLLKTFTDVCVRHNLTYWAYGGTLLGAIRHKGYIPWDDDVDVAMPREDYDTLCSHPEWFEFPIALHLPSNKEKYYEGWLRLHDICTAVLYENYKKEGSTQGIYIDVFPIDNYSSSISDDRKIKTIWKYNIIGHAFVYNVNKGVAPRLVSKITRFFHLFNCEKTFLKINNLARSNNITGFVMMKVGHFYKKEKQIFEKKDFSSSEQADFEFLKINIPFGWNQILKRNYGDYLVFPPIEKRGCWHSFIFDPNKSYLEYKPNVKE